VDRVRVLCLSRDDRSQQADERTEEDREREREERARRRAAQEARRPPIPVVDAGQPGAAWEPPPVSATVAPAPSVPQGPGRRSGRRSAAARAGAVLALLCAGAVIWLLVHALGGKSNPKPIPPPVAVKVLIPEGKTRLQIAQIASSNGLTGSYRAASRRSALLNPAHYGAPGNTPDLEGFLFPATYEMNPGASVSQLVNEQLIAFRQHFGSSQIRRAHELGVTPYELLTVASMIEREAQTSHDRPLIAAVIYNRLHQGMPLGIDATIYYAVELQRGIATYTSELTEAQLHIDSPYNTRTHTGLPPTPISNPGLASIEAAAHPAHVSYLYYVAAADGCGEQAFSTSEAAFERNVAAYRAAEQANGGHPPTCKRK
jgi:cell division protein YceG involved in septum cleavage